MKSNNETRTQNDSIENNYVGEWQSIERDSPFDAILAIDSNKNFKYIGGACVTSFESEGNWILQADTIILNSIKPKKCCYINEFGSDCVAVRVNDSTISERKVSIINCKPETLNEYIIFDNEKFLIINSVLTHIPKRKLLCPPTRDKFTKMKEIPQ